MRTLFDSDREMVYCAECCKAVPVDDCDIMGGGDCLWCSNCGAVIVTCELGLIAPAGNGKWRSIGGAS